jgi:hypothetical protein
VVVCGGVVVPVDGEIVTTDPGAPGGPSGPGGPGTPLPAAVPPGGVVMVLLVVALMLLVLALVLEKLLGLVNVVG